MAQHGVCECRPSQQLHQRLYPGSCVLPELQLISCQHWLLHMIFVCRLFWALVTFSPAPQATFPHQPCGASPAHSGGGQGITVRMGTPSIIAMATGTSGKRSGVTLATLAESSCVGMDRLTCCHCRGTRAQHGSASEQEESEGMCHLYQWHALTVES